MFNEYSKFEIEPRKISQEVVKAFENLFRGKKDAMFSSAVSAEGRANHHKHVNVGCCMLVLNKELNLAEPEVFTGANTKASPAMMAWPDRECAESRSFLNALNIPRSGSAEDPNWSGADIGMEMGTLKEGGVVAAVLTVSKNENTGEHDRLNHSVLISCDQCVVNYEGLMKLGIVNEDTIIYNARIDEKGEEQEHVEQSLGKLIEDFYKKKEKRDQAIIERLVAAKHEALNEYQREISDINLQFGSPAENPVPPIMPDDRYQAQRGYQRERVEAVWEVMENCLADIIKAAKGAAERGLSKERIVQTLGLEEFKLDPDAEKFTNNELKTLEELLSKALFQIYRKE